MYFWIPHKLCIERCIWPLLLGFVVVVGVSEMVRSNFHTVDPFHTNLRTYTQARIWLVRTWFIPRCYRRHSNPSDSCPDRWLKYCTQALSFPPLPRQHGIFHQKLSHSHKLRKNSPPSSEDAAWTSQVRHDYSFLAVGKVQRRQSTIIYSAAQWPPVPSEMVFPSMMDAKILH